VSAVTRVAPKCSAARPRLGAVSFLNCFGSALNHHVHLHACATDGGFMPTGDGPPAFLPAREKSGFKAGSSQREKIDVAGG
jgi:hypothetical protein